MIVDPESIVYVFDTAQGKPVYVAEVPGCRFNGLPICLSTKNKTEVPKVKAAVHKFRQWYNDTAARMARHGRSIN